MQKRLATSLLMLVPLVAGCDPSWQALAAAVAAATDNAALAIVAVGALDRHDDQTWWDRNDQHFDWLFWPFN